MLILDMLVIGHNSTFKERIPIHESCARKLDTFIKSFDIRIASTGKRPQKGDNLEFMSANVLGTSGWVRLKVTDFEFEDGGKGKKNEIDRYLTDREKYPKTAVPDLMGVKAEEETFDDPGIAASAADDEF